MAEETVGFARLQSASRVREVIKKLATQEIATQIPNKNIGRVMSVDLPRLRATVWFPNDEQPIEVKLLSSVIPGDWQHKTDNSGSYDSLSGYGSQAVVERLNGSLYVTQVLTGGQFSFDFRTMNHSIVAQKATPTSAGDTTSIEPIVDQPLETFINCRISDFNLADKQAIDFGPFTQYYDGEPGIGWIEVSVSLTNMAVKSYRFVVNPIRDFDHPGSTGLLDSWFRIIPEMSITDNNGADADFDFDISYKRTVYGNTADYSGYPEIWFRVVKRGTEWSGLDALITIRATNIQKGRSLGGRELFMQETRTSPPEIHGYLGFHNSQMLWRDTDDYAIFDNFGRVVNPGWGKSDSGLSWSQQGGTSYTDGSSGVLQASGITTQSVRTSSNLVDYDCSWVCWSEQVATGAEFQFAGLFRYLDNNNKYWFKVVFDQAGVLKLAFVKSVAGTATNIGSDVTMPFTYSANTRIRARMQMIGTALRGKLWLDGTREPEAWTKTDTDSALPGGAGYGYGFTYFPGGANTNTRPSRVHVTDVKLFVTTPGIDNLGSMWHTGPWRSGQLRTATDVQRTLTTDSYGIQIVAGERVKWGTIYLSGIGQHRDGFKYARANLSMPAVGTSIPLVPSGNYQLAVDSNGVFLDAEQALYVAVPPGADWKDLVQYLFIVDGGSNRDYQLPEWAVLIASRGPAASGPAFRLGTGVLQDSWTGPSFTNGWSNYGFGWDVCSFRKESNNVVSLRGLITGGTLNTAAFTLPVGRRPRAGEIFSVVANTGTARVNVNSDGTVVVYSYTTGGSNVFVSLSGISFEAAV